MSLIYLQFQFLSVIVWWIRLIVSAKPVSLWKCTRRMVQVTGEDSSPHLQLSIATAPTCIEECKSMKYRSICYRQLERVIIPLAFLHSMEIKPISKIKSDSTKGRFYKDLCDLKFNIYMRLLPSRLDTWQNRVSHRIRNRFYKRQQIKSLQEVIVPSAPSLLSSAKRLTKGQQCSSWQAFWKYIPEKEIRFLVVFY